jgi:cytochrome c oxidase subunit 2
MIDTAEQYQDLFDVYWRVGLGVMLVVWVAMLVLAVRYRRRRGDESWPEQVHERKLPEAAYIAVLAGIAGMLVFLTFTTMSSLTADSPADPASAAGRPGVRIDVTAARWNWRFDYPGLGITQVGTGTEIPTLVVPRGDVRFSATSVDVIHSFFIPSLRFKRDAFPARRTAFALGFPETGFFEAEGECAEFCGLRHAYMRFNVRVLEPGAFRSWARERRAGRPQERTPTLNRDGRFE